MKTTLTYGLMVCFAAGCLATARAQLEINNFDVPIIIDLAGFTAPATWATSSPGAGQLDSDTWSLNGAAFGTDMTAGQGASSGGVSTAGIYAFDVDNGKIALGFQPTSSFFNPGSLTMRIQNTTGATIAGLAVDWSVFVFNDSDRSSSVSFAYSSNNSTFTNAGASFTITSPGPANSPASWVENPLSINLTGLNIANNAFYYLRWTGQEVGGSGLTRDEFGLADIVVTAAAVPETSSALLMLLGAAALFARRRMKS
jgi:hypothetical protein